MPPRIVIVAAAVGVLATAYLAAARWRAHGIALTCDELGVGGDTVDIAFAVDNHGGRTVRAIDVEIFDTDLQGCQNSEAAHYTLRGPFAPGSKAQLEPADVPVPPHWHAGHFSKLTCALVGVDTD